MKRATLLKYAYLLGLCAGTAAHAQVFNMHNVQHGYASYGGYNVMAFGQGAFSDSTNNVWNGFDNGGNPGSTDTFGGGRPDDVLFPGNPGNPYAHSTDGYFAPNSGATTVGIVPFSPSTSQNKLAGNAYSSGALSPITVPTLVRGFDSGNALDVSLRNTPGWIFSEAAVVNTGNPGVGTFLTGPQGLCVLSNVPPGTYDLYLYGANFDGTRGAKFIAASGTPSQGIFTAINPNAAVGSGPLNSYILGSNYVVFNNVVPDGSGTVSFTWGAVSNSISGLSGEGDFNGLQLVKSSPVTAGASIIQQPINSIFPAGTTATLFADGRGNPAVSYTWNKVGSGVVPGQTANTLTIPNVQSGSAGSYFVVVSNSAGSVTSSTVTLNVEGTPTVEAQSPSTGVTIASGQSVPLSITTSGATPLTYFWKSNGTVVSITGNGTPFTNNTGSVIDFAATTSSTTISNITSSCSLSCLVSNSSGTVADNPIAVSVIPLPTGTFASAVLADNPVAYYTLSETSGTTAFNYGSLGLAADGVYLPSQGGVTMTTGVAGPPGAGLPPSNFAVQFGGSQGNSGPNVGVVAGSSANGQNPALLAFGPNGGPMTMSCWILVTSPAGWFQGILGRGDASYRIAMNGSTPQFAPNNNNNDGNVNAGGNEADGNWHWMVASYDGANTDKIYIDGVLRKAFTGESARPVNTTQPLWIGSVPDYNNRNFIGTISQVAIFNTALADSQVTALYNAAGIPPTVSSPANMIYNAGAVATLGPVKPGGSGPFSYQWFKGTPGSGTLLNNGNRISGATSSSLVINPVAGSDQNTYYVVVTTPTASVTSSAASLTVNTTVSARLFTGGSPIFSVTPGPFHYQWSTNGTAVAGATKNSFTLSNITGANNNETVQCAITDPSFTGTVNGSLEKLTIVSAPTDMYPVAVLHDHPIAYYRLDEFNYFGDNGAGDDGTNAFDYAGGNNGIYSNVVLNATGVPYGPPLTNTDGDAAFGSLGTSDSFAAFIPIDFSLAPSNSPAQPGNAEFSVEAWVNGNAGQHNGGFVTKGFGQGSQNASAGFFEQFSLQNSVLGTSGSRIEFDVTDASGNESVAGTGAGTLNSAWHHVVGVCDQANGHIYLYVDGQLVNLSSGFGTGLITPGNGIMSTPVPMSIGAKQGNDTSGNYNGQWIGEIDEVAIYNYALSSSQVLNHYYAAGIAPTIVSAPPRNISADAGTDTNLTVVASGTPPLSYQWSGPGGVIPGATNATLTLVNVNQTGTPPNTGPGDYTLVVTNPYGTNNGTIVTLSVLAGPPQLVQDLSPVSFAIVGGSAVFTVAEQGSSPFTNVWQYNGTRVVNGGRISGATTPVLTITGVQASDAGNYQLLVTNSAGNVASTLSTLIVENEPLFNTNGAGWSLNGNTNFVPPVPSFSSNVLTITTPANGEANSVFFNSPMYIAAFKAKFTYQDVTAGGADGMSFCVQNDSRGLNATGGGGNEIGYTGITNSVALGLEVYTPNGGGTGWDYLTNGQATGVFTPPTPVNFDDGNPVDWTILYNGRTITLTLADETTGKAYTNTFVVGSIPALVGGNTAFVGFTGATGGVNALQTISNFSFTPFPVLSATTSGSSVKLTWPTGIGGYTLQKSSSLSSPNWTAVPGPYTIVGSNYQMTIASPVGNAFYRLVVSN